MDLEHIAYLKLRDIKIQNKIPQQQIEKLEILIHWIFGVQFYIIQVCQQNNLDLKTIELASNLIKIYMSKSVLEEDLELLAMTSLLIAVKFNECQNKLQMNIEDCVEQCRCNYSPRQVLEMEMCILSFIDFDANITTISDYYDGEPVQTDLILFVTLDSDFLYYEKYQLYDAIRNFYNQDTKSLEQTTQEIIKSISAKICLLTQTETQRTPKINRRMITKKKNKNTRRQSSSSITI